MAPPPMPATHFFSIIVLISLLLPPLLPSPVSSLSFNLSDFNGDRNTGDVILLGDAWFGQGGIQLTKHLLADTDKYTTGRALYREPLQLWDRTSGKLTDFVTHFSFNITNTTSRIIEGDGLAFFLAPLPSNEIPLHSEGGNLGLFNKSANKVVAVEFDTFDDSFDPRSNNSHVGIDVDSVYSIATVPLGIRMVMDNTAHVTITYNSSNMVLSVGWNYKDLPPQVDQSGWKVSTTIDLRDYLPEQVAIGFSGSTSTTTGVRGVESHAILSWDFSSTLQTIRKRSSTRLLLEVLLGVVIFVCGVGLTWFASWCRQRRRKLKEGDFADDIELSVDHGILDYGGSGPKRFRYHELAAATKNFAQEGKLGEGGFGSVYLGVLPVANKNNDLSVAIKRISKGSAQGKKEYVSEVTIISRLRHRNLVQLIGYCHQGEEFLLVYQFMPKGSLDSHLYNNERLLPWPERYKISVGLAFALLYLHEEWEQCIVHRDLKPSNVMLDEDFTPKLGDFGLARLVDHDNSAKTTVLAGTRGYMAPEYEETGKASRESDVYGFGVVVLEIACGRRPIELSQVAAGKVSLILWVRELYENGMCLAAADGRLDGDFDKRLMERLIVVGLWCAHTDYKLRPSMREVVGVLRYDAPLPELPPLTREPMHQNYSYAASSTSGVSSKMSNYSALSSSTSTSAA